jgi:hypothetical protein
MARVGNPSDRSRSADAGRVRVSVGPRFRLWHICEEADW